MLRIILLLLRCLIGHISIIQPSLSELAKRDDFPTQPVVPSEFIRKHGATYSGMFDVHVHNSHYMPLYPMSGLTCQNANLPTATKSDSTHVVIDNHLVTGQSVQSTLTAVQNLILLSNAR